MSTKSSALITCLLALVVAPAELAAASAQRERSPERVFAALKRRMDKNLDGKISRDEFTQRDRVFRRFDVDGDGVITLEDVKAREKTRRGDPAGDAAGDPGGDPVGDEAAKGGEPETSPDEMSGSMGEVATFTSEAIDFFESKIRPVLANECFSCHSSGGRRKGGLSLDSRHGFLTGGESGAALVPGDVDASLFIEAIRYDDLAFAMPPKNKLSDQEIADLEAWVRMGAPWPADLPPSMDDVVAFEPTDFDDGERESLNRDIDIDEGREFWSFQPVTRPDVPLFDEDDWSRSDIDRFLLAGMSEAGVEPVSDANDRTWLRRVTFDLTGLPPTLEEIAAYEADRAEDRDARVVDRLLASSAYAERWGRHWLDVARYGESSGKDRNVVYPHAWRYRDWVLEAFRQDMPYDEFLRLQIAGDLVPAETNDERAWNQIATGFLAIGPKGHAERDPLAFKLTMVDEQIDAMSRGMLGLTLSCARCHDHKFDPIPTEDYYAIAGIFLSTETHFGTFKAAGNNHASDLVMLPDAAGLPNGPSMAPALLAVLERGADRLSKSKEMDPVEMDSKDMSGDDRKRALNALQERRRDEQRALLDDLFERFDEDGRARSSNRLAMGVSEGEPRDIAVLDRGEVDRPGEIARRGMPQVLRSASTREIGEGSGRLELADFIASDENPLTARVWANRVWLHLFGTGLVATPDNFGAGGQAPTHPELLDYLASELVASGWSTKGLIRTVVLSRAYRLDSAGSRKNEAIDPDVTWLWRMPERRLESEALRDAMLMLSGTLSAERPVGSPTGTLEGSLRGDQLIGLVMREAPVRSVYLPSPRGFTMDTLEVFDAPDAEFVTGDRDETTVPTQALFLMNDDAVLKMSDGFAAKLLAMDVSDTVRIRRAFELAYGRLPSTTEVRVVKSFLRDYERDYGRVAQASEEEGQKAASRSPRDAKDARARERQRRREARRAERLQQQRELSGAPAPLKNAEHAAWSAFTQSLFQSAEFRAIG